MLWVVDPQKYADAALHERYLARLAGRDAALAVVMNQLDRIEAATAATLGADLRRLLQEDGLGGAAVLAASAATGGGLPSLRKLLVDRVSARQASCCGSTPSWRRWSPVRQSLARRAPHPVTNREAGDLVANLTYASAGDELVERLLVEGRLKGPVVISENHVERAVSDLVEPIFDPLPLQWQRFGERLIDPRRHRGGRRRAVQPRRLQGRAVAACAGRSWAASGSTPAPRGRTRAVTQIVARLRPDGARPGWPRAGAVAAVSAALAARRRAGGRRPSPGR